MLKGQELKAKVDAYVASDISLGEFEDWFYENSTDQIESAAVEEVVDAVDALLSERHLKGASQSHLRKALGALSLRPKRTVLVVPHSTVGSVIENRATYVLLGRNIQWKFPETQAASTTKIISDSKAFLMKSGSEALKYQGSGNPPKKQPANSSVLDVPLQQAAACEV